MKKFILSFTCFIVSLFLFVPMDVRAYTSEDNFYPLVTSNSFLNVSKTDGSTQSFTGTYSNGCYSFNNPVLYDVKGMQWHPENAIIFPYVPDVYDYYLLFSLTGLDSTHTNSTFKPTYVTWQAVNYNDNSLEVQEFEETGFYNVDSGRYAGFGFFGKVDIESTNNIGIHMITMSRDKDGSGTKPANLCLEVGILAVEKNSSEDVVQLQILNQLKQMENSITGSIDSASNSITSKLQESFDSLTSNLNDWFNDVFNGYDGTGTSDASDKFGQSAEELESVEKDLTDITNSSIETYTDSAFDTSVIASLGSSLVYVVTWFTNFWDMGGLFTSILNVGLALSIAFFILRLRGGD